MSIKKLSKIIVALMIVATILSAANLVLASTPAVGTIPTAQGGGLAAGGLSSTVGNVIGVIQFICYAAAVILLVMLGIKFMTASPDGKAEVKKSAVIYVVGAILVFAAGALLNLVKNIGDKTVVTK